MTAQARLGSSSLAALLALGACATVPTGPTVPALPGTGKSLEQFRDDDVVCQQYALAQLGGTSPGQAASGSGRSAAAAKEGVEAGAARASAYDMQRRYDFSYIQCMYVKGHRVPVLGPMAILPAGASSPPPSPGTLPAPPGVPR